MTAGYVFASVLYGCDSPHRADLLCAIQCGNPEPEILLHMESGRTHCLEQWRKRTTVTVDDGRICTRERCFPFLNPGNRLVHIRAAFFDVEDLCLSGLVPRQSMRACSIRRNL